MVRKFFAVATASILLFAPSYSFSAIADQTPPATSSNQSSQPSQSAESAKSSDDSNGERSRPLHRINEEREGHFEGAQLILVGAALVIALGLAYRAGRRRREE